jgi:hypothetical protein
MTKSMSSFMVSLIHWNVWSIRVKGESQADVSAPYMPAGPRWRWHAASSVVLEYVL